MSKIKQKMKLLQIKDYLLWIDEDAEIKPDDYIIHDTVDGIVEANDEWHYRGEKDDYWDKVIAYYPLKKEAKELDLPLLPPFEEVDIEELAYAKYPVSPQKRKVFLEGYKAAQSKQFSLEDMKDIMEEALNWWGGGRDRDISDSEDFFERYIKSLSTQQLPKLFIPEYEKEIIGQVSGTVYVNKELKTTTNQEGKEVLCGTYKY